MLVKLCIFFDLVLEEVTETKSDGVISENTVCRTKVRGGCFVFRGKLRALGELWDGSVYRTITIKNKSSLAKLWLSLQF